MSAESVASLILGFLLGMYSGVVMARYTRFTQLRDEVLRIIRSIDFMQEQGNVVISNAEDVSKLTLIVSDLLFLKHRKAADAVAFIRSDIDEMSMHAKAGRLKVSAFEQNYSSWQSTARMLLPNKIALWSPWAKL